MDFRILGPLEVQAETGPLPLGGTKQRALLAILLLNPNQVVSSDRLLQGLWGDEPPETAVKALQVHVSALRKLLEPARRRGESNRVLLTRPPGYLIQIEPEQLDLTRFERLRAEASQALAGGDPAGARAKLSEGLSLWRGPPLADFTYEPFAHAEIARLEELRLAAVEERIEADLALGRHADVVGELEGLIDLHPLRERMRGQRMLALYRSGRQAEALEAYRETRRTLIDELGIEPGRELHELERAILVQDRSLDLEAPDALARPREDAALPDAEPAGGSFVGRDRELGELLGGLEGALARRPALFLIAGEPGIGKSRLADEVTVRAEARGAKVLSGRCWEAGGAPAYWPWVQALRPYFRDTDHERIRTELGTGAPDIAQMLPELHELLPDLPAAPSLDPDGARFRLFDSMASFLRAAGEVQPLVLVIDDLHAADTPSLLLLRFLARELREARIVLVGAYRDTEAGTDDALNTTVAELRREPLTRLVRLGGLALPEVASFIELIAGGRSSEGLASAIHRETEGNPLFVGELVRLLASEGRLEEAGSAPWTTSIPQGVHEVIEHRLRHLSADCKDALSVASILGREFRLDALERVSERSPEELLDLLDEALVARVVGDLPAGRGGLRFSHALIRDSLYGGLGTKERRRLHRRAAEALEALYSSDREPHLAELAHHFLEAAPGGDVDKAIAYAWQAGNRAAVLLAYEEAARLYEMGLEAVELKATADEPTRCELLLALGDAQARGGDLPSAKGAFARAAEVARSVNAPEQLARAALGYGGRFIWFRAGKDRRLIPLLEEALEALPGDNPLRARLLARLAGALRDQPVPERRASLSREAVRIARSLGERATLAYALEGAYAALSWPRDTDAWLAMARELIELADEAGDKEQAFSGHLHAFGAFMVRGDLGAAEAEFTTMTALGQELRQPAQLWALSVAETMRAFLAGQFEEAERFIGRTVQLGTGAGAGALGDTTFHYVIHLQNWGLRRERGGLAEVREPIERFVAEYPTFLLFRCLLANLYSQLGHEVEAREELDRLAADDFAALEVGTEWFFAASLLAEVCAFLGAASPAADLYEALLRYGECNVIAHPEFSLGSASRYLGLLASTTSRWEDAAGHFERALDMNARMGARPWVAHTQDDYARMLLARDEAGDRERALELIGEALATYRELGMESWAANASELEHALRAAPAPRH
jgi:DNA-binding SARP family transcriptional activator/tetratricopeptide (TPR) repeat protein